MNVADTVRAHLLDYPDLFKTRGDVLHHMFLVIGTGCEWRNGELVNRYQKAKRKPDNAVYRDEELEALRFDTEIFPAVAGETAEVRTLREGQREHHLERVRAANAELRAVRENIDTLAAEDAVAFSAGTIYPLSRYSPIVNLPDDVQPDWLDAARSTLMAVFQHLSVSYRVYDERDEGRDFKNNVKWADKAMKSLHKRFGKWYDEEPGSFAEFCASLHTAHIGALKDARFREMVNLDALRDMMYGLRHGLHPHEVDEHRRKAGAARSASVAPAAPAAPAAPLRPPGEITLMDLVRSRPLTERDRDGLKDLRDMAGRDLEMAKLLNDQVRGMQAETLMTMIDAETARRNDLEASAPSFQVGDTVQIVRDLSDWNKATSAKPPVGMTGTVVELDSYDAKHLPAGKVPVRLSMAELGYAVDEDDEDSLYKTFFIHAWALRTVAPRIEPDEPSLGGPRR